MERCQYLVRLGCEVAVKISQLVLLVVVFGSLWLALRHRRRQEARAFRRLAFIGLGVATVVAIVFPDLLTAVAHLIGIGRGADLVSYLVAIGLLFFSLSTYLKFGEMDRRITLLTRHIALLEDAGTLERPERDEE